MKKFVRMLCTLALVLICAGTFVACLGAELTKLELKASSFKTEYVVGDDINTSTIVVYAHYSNNTKKEIPADQLTIGDISSETVGTKTLTVTYKDKTLNIKVTIFNSLDDSYEIQGIEMPSFVNEYYSHTSEKQNKETEFFDRDNPYVVGDDNEFVFLPVISALNDNDELIILNRFQSVVDMYIKEGENYTLLTDELETYVKIDNVNSSFDFTEDAIGETFKFEMSSFYYPDFDAITFEVTVVDGWNAYSAVDLSRISSNSTRTYRVDNNQTATSDQIWQKYKEDNNVGNEKINAIILHNSISLTLEDIPEMIRYNETDLDVVGASDFNKVKNTIRDYHEIYSRYLQNGETFEIHGNYFTLDYSNLPFVVRDDGSILGEGQYSLSHSSLFRFEGENNENQAERNSYTMSNLNIVGRSNRSEEMEKAGGLIVAKNNNTNYTMYNVITRSNFIAIFPEEQNTSTLADKVKIYDGFSSAVFVWASSDVVIKDSEIKRFGGPAILLNHRSPSTQPDSYSATQIQNSVIEAFVTGEEGWFTLTGAKSLVTTLTSLDPLIRHNTQNAKTIVNPNPQNPALSEVNLVCAIIDGSATVSGTSADIKGKFTYNNLPTSLNMLDDVTVRGILNTIKVQKSIMFENPTSGERSMLIEGANPTVLPYDFVEPLTYLGSAGTTKVAPTANFALGNMLNVYMSPAAGASHLAAMIGYYNVAA